MGGHGGLNILPQKRWNVYNYENREKVRKDEEAAAREEQLKRDQSRRRDSEFRLELLRRARGLDSHASTSAANTDAEAVSVEDGDAGHVNLFDANPDFAFLAAPVTVDDRKKESDKGDRNTKKRRREEDAKAKAPMSAEDEKYRLGYGVAGKGVKAPWYLSMPSTAVEEAQKEQPEETRGEHRANTNKINGKKTIEDLRAERRKRERKERDREMLVIDKASGRKRHECNHGKSRRDRYN